MNARALISTIDLRVNDFAGLTDFYAGLLGMQAFQVGGQTHSYGFDPDRCHIVFHKANVAPFAASSSDFYWKIGITVRNLDRAVAFLRDKGLKVPEPVQFRDIGYMSKISDPRGFNIELLQQGFEGNEQSVPSGHPIGSQASLAHITLRITDIANARQYFEQDLGMRLMSVQPVADRSFCLYFYCWSDEALPDSNLQSVQNRPWLWARPYALIELQHLQLHGAAIHKSAGIESGFKGFSFLPNEAKEPTIISMADLEQLS